MIQHFKTRPRLSLAIFLGLVSWFVLPESWGMPTRLLLSWDFTTAFYLIAMAWMMGKAKPENIRNNACKLDEGKFMILTLTTLAAIASLAAIVMELASAKELHGVEKGQHVGLAMVTVILSWSFLHAMYALHYAHEYYSEGKGDPFGGLDIPGNLEKPDYWDFVYFSFIIGTACATADINITSKPIRRTATLHCIIAFFFNTTILAFTINIGAGLFN